MSREIVQIGLAAERDGGIAVLALASDGTLWLGGWDQKMRGDRLEPTWEWFGLPALPEAAKAAE